MVNTLAATYPSAAAATGIGSRLMILLMLMSGTFVPLAVLPVGVRLATSFSPIRHLADPLQGLWNAHP